jgi:hypothetical protein
LAATEGPVYIYKTDLSNFYHSLSLPEWMRPFFALPPVRLDELPSSVRSKIPKISDDVIWPTCTTLCMGFSHAVHIGQSVHQNVVYTSCPALSPATNILHVRQPFLSPIPVHGLYIDDKFGIGTDPDACVQAQQQVLAAYKQAGLIVNSKKTVEPTCEGVEVLGIRINGSTGVASVSPAKLTALAARTVHLLRCPTVTGQALSEVIGGWTWCMLVRRPALSILQHSYRYIRVAKHQRFTLWASVRRELLLCLALMPLMCASLRAPLFSRIMCTDASTVGGAVVSTKVPVGLSALPFFCQLWSSATACRPIDPSTGAPHTPSLLSLLDGAWSTISAYRWRRPEHINALELRAILSALSWVLSTPYCIGTRVFLLTDNTVSYYALRKGRCSSPLLLLLMRRVAALSLASAIQLLPVWVPSASNPADGPSRLLN